MKIRIADLLADLLESFSNKIRAGSCELSEEDALNLISNIAHIKLDKRDVAEELNISERSVDRLVTSNKISPGKKHLGDTKLIWYLDEIIKYKNDNN